MDFKTFARSLMVSQIGRRLYARHYLLYSANRQQELLFNLPDHSAWIASCKDIIRDIFCDHTSRSNDTP